MNDKTGGPAFPNPEIRNNFGGDTFYQAAWPGMDLRDWFAGQALGGLLANYPTDVEFPLSVAKTALAQIAYEIADAMIAERSKP